MAIFLLASTSIAFLGVSVANGWAGPKAFLKRRDGRLHPLSYFVFWPYHLMNSLSLLGFRLTAGNKAYSQIDTNLYLGCRLSRRDRGAIEALGVGGVLDLTCEFGEVGFLRKLPAYRCIPVLDTCAPSLEQLKEGVAWIQSQVALHPVYVHCALGRGRSATFVAGCLLLAHKVASAEEAIHVVNAARGGVGLSRSQRQALDAFQAEIMGRDAA